jgi:hypothetical protein
MQRRRRCAISVVRETADLDVAVADSVTAAPIGSRPTPWRQVVSPDSIRSSAICPGISVAENSSWVDTASSPEPSTARTRGRRAGTRRPPRVTEPPRLTPAPVI